MTNGKRTSKLTTDASRFCDTRETANPNLSRCSLRPFPRHSTLTTAIFLSQVLEVEDEMRILLQENALTKKTLEQRLKKLSSAFTEIQHDLAGS